MSAGSSTVPPRGSSTREPSKSRCTIGSTPAPGASGETSTWAISPTVWGAPFVAGSVA